MKKHLKLTMILISIVVFYFFAFGYINSYFSWYSHEHGKYRKASRDIKESKQRGVFFKELSFKIEGYSGDLNGF